MNLREHNKLAFVRNQPKLEVGDMVDIVTYQDLIVGIVIGYVMGDVCPWIVAELPKGRFGRYNRDHLIPAPQAVKE